MTSAEGAEAGHGWSPSRETGEVPGPRRLGGEPAGLCQEWGGAACTCPPSLVFCTPTFSPREAAGPWQDPGWGGGRLGFGHGQSMTCCVTPDGHFTSLGLSFSVQKIPKLT